MENVFVLFYTLFMKLLNYSQMVYAFLFETHTLGFEGIEIGGVRFLDFSIDINLFGMIGSTALITILILYLVKTFIPVA